MSTVLSALRRPAVLVVIVLLIAAGGAAYWWSTGDEAEPLPTTSGAASTATPTPSESPTASPTPSGVPSCEGPTTRLNADERGLDSLLPDCGERPVTQDEQKAKGLGLACGGSYPIILYKTSTADLSSSICGKTSSGEKLRVVVRTADGSVHDLGGSYRWESDTFVGKLDGTTYTIRAYDGAIVVKGPSGSSTQASTGWSSLDNESDYD